MKNMKPEYLALLIVAYIIVSLGFIVVSCAQPAGQPDTSSKTTETVGGSQ